MLLILPPSETKRDGGADGSVLDLASLSFPQLNQPRKKAISALRALSRNLGAAAGALHLGRTQRFEIDRNRALLTSPVMLAIDRYTGVLYDGLDVETASPAARAFAEQHLLIHSALFGILGALDPIPAYRLSHDSRLPGLSLRKHWSASVAQVLAERQGLILDLRSESYVALGPAPETASYLRVFSADGRTALTHFNKKSKGEFARAVMEAGIDHPDVASLMEWATHNGIRLALGAPGELDLVV